jgi:hypothetical protein
MEFFMKKVFKMKQTVLAAVLFAGASAYAQVAAPTHVAPGAPDMTVLTTPGSAAALSQTTTNRVFIDQDGINPKVDMQQTGNSNKMGPITGGATATSPVYLRGDDQTITAVQTGNNNELGLSAVGKNAKVSIQQIGNSNKIDAKVGADGGATNALSDGAAITGASDNMELNWKFTGHSNELRFRAGGLGIKSNIDVAGDGNKIAIDALGAGHSQTIKSVGSTTAAANEFNFSQKSTGSSGSSIAVDVSGAGNKFFIAQSGAQDNVVNIKSAATSGTWNITQK